MKEFIESLPANIKFHADCLRKDYKNPAFSHDAVRAEIRGYANGLYDAGMLTAYQRGMLCIYCFT